MPRRNHLTLANQIPLSKQLTINHQCWFKQSHLIVIYQIDQINVGIIIIKQQKLWYCPALIIFISVFHNGLLRS